MIGLGRRAAMEFYLGKLCYWMFFICSVFFNQGKDEDFTFYA